MTLYLIRWNGRWKSGSGWTDDPAKAKTWSNIGTVRNRLARFKGAEVYSVETSAPVLLETESQQADVRRARREEKKKREKLRRLERDVRNTQKKIELEKQRLVELEKQQ